MGFSWVFVIIHLFLASDGFLLDDRTSPATTSGPLLSDQHYNFLINLIMNERQTRAKLEQHVVRMEQELLATQQGVTDIYHTSSINNATLEQQTKNWNVLYAKYINLENENSFMKSNLNALRTDHTNLENYTKLLEREVTSLRHLKGVTDLQTVLNVRNETNILRKELKITIDSLNSVRNEAEARKQDFVALLNKADSTEHKLDLSVKSFDDKLEYQQNQTKFEMKLMKDQMEKLEKLEKSENQTLENLRESLAVVHGIQNVTVGKLDMEINNMSNRTALTSCVHTNDEVYTGGSIIPFSNVKTRFGISDSIVTVLSSSGKFKCEKPGLYLISAFIMTGSTGFERFNVYRNNDKVNSFFSSVGSGASNYQTSTFLILQYLHIDDSLYIINESKAHIFSNDRDSCISFLQLSNS